MNKKRVNFQFKPNEINSILHKLEGKTFKDIILDFDFDNETLTINESKKFKVERDHEFTYKFMKTKIKAIGGIEALYKFIEKENQPDAFFNNRITTVLCRAMQL